MLSAIIVVCPNVGGGTRVVFVSIEGADVEGCA